MTLGGAAVPEDELSRSTGYHYALPLEVHGSGYSQMQMVTHAKADKLVSRNDAPHESLRTREHGGKGVWGLFWREGMGLFLLVSLPNSLT